MKLNPKIAMKSGLWFCLTLLLATNILARVYGFDFYVILVFLVVPFCLAVTILSGIYLHRLISRVEKKLNEGNIRQSPADRIF